jgi:succinate dehydrogenase / fumarate reductase cytochrome b subunit
MSNMQDSREATMHGHRSDGSAVRRPLSPHLQAYDMLQMSSLLSILSRVTGVIWAVGLLGLVWWLVALSMGPDTFETALAAASHPLGQLVLVGMTVAAWYHTLAGIRHLNWDIGRGFSIPAMYRSGWAIIILTVVLSVATWLPAIPGAVEWIADQINAQG